MTKLSKIKNNLSPTAIPVITFIPQPELNDKIKKIELKYQFQDEFLFKGLTNLINWFQLENELERQTLRPADEKKYFIQLRETTDKLLQLLNHSAPQIRNTINDTLIKDDFLIHKSEDQKRSAAPYIIEDALEIFKDACIYSENHLEIDLGGNTPNSSKPKNIIFQLIELYQKSTNKQPTCYDDTYTETGFNGDFYHFLLELNPILIEINPEMDLGTPVTIGSYAKECLAKVKTFNVKT